MWIKNIFSVAFLSFLNFYNVSFVVWCSNLSPLPNIVYRVPNLNTTLEKVRSSYFGYSLVLREQSLFIGAPRAQSVWENQADIIEPGLIYRCSLDYNDTNCSPYPIDINGDLLIKTFPGPENKNKQFLGASMVGGPKEGDLLLICAPLYSVRLEVHTSFAHGICYVSHNTKGKSPARVGKIKALIGLSEQSKKFSYYYMMGEQGFSAHITPNNEELLLGAPGVLNWGGSVVRYGMISKRIDIPNGDENLNSYFGYAVTSGYLDSKNRTNLIYVMTSPHTSQPERGEAKLFEFFQQNMITTKTVLYSAMYGEFFGYAALVEDINGDNLDDLLITAPLYNIQDIDVGAVYVFINAGEFNFRRRLIIAPFKTQARFGTAISKLGDINHDGYADIAVGAPFIDGHGAVVIYLGSANGLQKKASQILGMEPPIEASMFGHALSNGVDIDGNGFTDLAVGAPGSEVVYVYRSYPVVDVKASILSEKSWLEFNETMLQIEYCFRIETKSETLKWVMLNMDIELDLKLGRVSCLDSGINTYKSIINATMKNQCRNFMVKIKFLPVYIFSPMQLVMKYELVNGGKLQKGREFCSNCAVISSYNTKRAHSSIGYIHGYRDLIINVDLRIHALKIPKEFILGTSKVLFLNYMIENLGEEAYDAKFEIFTSMQVPYLKIPPNCVQNVDEENNNKLNCKLVEKYSFTGRTTFEIELDVSEIIESGIMNITAAVTSFGNEMKPKDNVLNTIIELKRITNLEIEGQANETFIHIDYKPRSFNISYNFQIQNNGPSTLYKSIIWVFVPAAYRNQGHEFVSFINLNKSHASNTDTNEIFSQKSFDMNEETPEVVELNERTFKELLQLPEGHTISLNCDSMITSNVKCAAVRLPLQQLKVGEILKIAVTLNIKRADLKRILLRNRDYMELLLNTVIQSKLKGDVTLNIMKAITPEVLISSSELTIPFWVYLASATCGFCMLAIITLILREFGFFKRLTKAEMEEKIDKKIMKARRRKLKELARELENTEDNELIGN